MYNSTKVAKAQNYIASRMQYGMRIFDALDSAAFVYTLNELEYTIVLVKIILKRGV